LGKEAPPDYSSHRLEEYDKAWNVYNKQNDVSQDIQILHNLADFTVKPVEIIEFTNNYDPIPFPGVNVGQGISGVFRDISDTGLAILDKGSNLIASVVDQGLNVLSEPIKIVIITASVIGGLILLWIAYKYVIAKENKQPHPINVAVIVATHPHIWKNVTNIFILKISS